MTQHANLGQMPPLARGPQWLSETNAAQQALASMSAGSAVPSPTYSGMPWWDTRTAPAVLRIRTLANDAWVAVGEMDGTTMRWYAAGAALGTAATRDYGTAANQLLALDASARLPAVDASQLLNLPASNSTGDIKLTLETTQSAGWLFCDGKTLGTVASGATYAGTTYQALFVFLWDRVTAAWCPLTDSAGNAVSRGASATADWAANRRLALPDARGSVLLVRDNLGGSTAGRVTAASTGGGNAAAIAARGGAETHALTQSELPVTAITTTGRAPGDHSGGFAGVEATSSGTTGTVPIATIGGGGAHSTMPPWFSLGLIIKI